MDDIQLSSSLFVRALLSAVCTSVIISICKCDMYRKKLYHPKYA